MRISDWSSDVCSSDLLRIKMTPYHDHSDERARADLVARMADNVVVLVSDAGTPLISDPGSKLLRHARAAGRHVPTVPRPRAALAHLPLSGPPTHRFLFSAFPPRPPTARPHPTAAFPGPHPDVVFPT